MHDFGWFCFRATEYVFAATCLILAVVVAVKLIKSHI
jgi:hypothetical protein